MPDDDNLIEYVPIKDLHQEDGAKELKNRP